MEANEEDRTYREFVQCYEQSTEELTKKSKELEIKIKENMTSPAYAECCRLMMLAYIDKKNYGMADAWRARAYMLSHLSGTTNVFTAMFASIAIRATTLGAPTSGLEALNCMEKIINSAPPVDHGYPARSVIQRLLHEKKAYVLALIGSKTDSIKELNDSITEYDKALDNIGNDKRGRIKVELGKALVYYTMKNFQKNGQKESIKIHKKWIEKMQTQEGYKFQSLLDQAKSNCKMIEEGVSVDKLSFYEIT